MNHINKGTDSNSRDHDKKQLLFYNYHEYSTSRYRALDSTTEDFHNQALIITHFPNSYVTRTSDYFERTRIVRIPRIFNSDGALYPQFSTFLPGNEDAAIKDNEDQNSFVIGGQYEDQYFATSSSSPLYSYFSQKEFEGIVTSINSLIRDAYTPWSLSNVMGILLDLFTLWVLGQIWKSSSTKKLEKVESYVTEINSKIDNRGVQIISPRRSAYLSLDFQIDKPVPNRLSFSKPTEGAKSPLKETMNSQKI